MHLLKVPAILSRLELDRQHRRRVQVVAGADGAVVIRRGVAGREVHEAELEIDGRRLPDSRAAVLPHVAVLRPRLVTGLAGTGNRVEGPQQTPVLRVVRLDAAARAPIAACKTHDDPAIDVQRRRRDREPVLRSLGLNGPRDLAGRAIERHEPAVELADEDLVFADRDALVVPAAADRRQVLREIRRVLPEDLAGIDRHGEHVVGARAHVRDAAVHERLREARVLRRGARAAQACAPHALELRDVGAVDGCERRVTLVVKVAAVGGPVRGRRRSQPGAEAVVPCALPLPRGACAWPATASSAAAAADTAT